ncbi:MAG: hypothetical protein GY832_10390 [Chloroflexi bacterium]|nr:hypothetical protein [Chloroflexota bacterium]
MHTVLLLTSFLVLLVALILHRKKGPSPSVRPLPTFQDLKSEVGYAAESGSAIHIALGHGGLYGESTITSLAGLQMVESLIDTAVSYNAPPIITVGDSTILPVAQDILRRAYERNNMIEVYDPNQVRFVAPSPVAYAAGAGHVIATNHVTTNVMMGAFGSEVSLIADAGARRDLPQLAAAAAPLAIGALYPATDRLAVGEELYAASAQMTEKRSYLVSLVTQDILRIIVVIAILWSALVALFE